MRTLLRMLLKLVLILTFPVIILAWVFLPETARTWIDRALQPHTSKGRRRR